MQTGKAIRKKAFALARVHWWKIWCISFCYTACFYIQKWMFPSSILNEVIRSLFFILLYPFYSVALSGILLDMWREKKDIQWDLLCCYRVPASWKVATVVAILLYLITYLTILPINLLSVATAVWGLALTLVSIVALCLQVWLQEHLLLVPYLLAVGYSTSPRTVLKKSFQAMKGNVWRHIGFFIAVCWWIIPISAIIVLAFPQSPKYSLLIMGLLVSVFSPYVLFCNIGFVNELLPSEKELKKRNHPKVSDENL